MPSNFLRMIAANPKIQVTSLPVADFTQDTGVGTVSDNILTCTTSGTFYYPFTKVYGTFEFTIFKAVSSTGNFPRVDYITDSIGVDANGYYLSIWDDEAIKIAKRTDGVWDGYLYLSSAGEVSKGVYIDFKIIRDNSGFTQIYIDDSLIGSFTNNDYTNNEYFIIMMYAGDKIGNITHKD